MKDIDKIFENWYEEEFYWDDIKAGDTIFIVSGVKWDFLNLNYNKIEYFNDSYFIIEFIGNSDIKVKSANDDNYQIFKLDKLDYFKISYHFINGI